MINGGARLADHGVKGANGEWRMEEIGFNPNATPAVEAIGVYLIDGKVVDYTIEVTDERGTFYIWARNLDYAVELQHYYGTARGYNLRNYEVDFDSLDEVGSTDDSTYRVELLTPQQFQFATALGGVDFRPEMLSSTYDNATGVVQYSVNQTGAISHTSGVASGVPVWQDLNSGWRMAA